MLDTIAAGMALGFGGWLGVWSAAFLTELVETLAGGRVSDFTRRIRR